MKFKCLAKDGKFIGNVNGEDADEALANAQKLSDKVEKVELIPGQKPLVKKAVAAKKGKPVLSAQAVMAAAAKRKKKDK